MRTDLPDGEVTLLFTDIEGSTNLLNQLGDARYAEVLAEHRRVVREAFRRHGGVEVDTQGDAFFYAFPSALGAVEAACEAQRELAEGPVKVRMGVHTGSPLLGAEGYVGEDVHLGARLAAVAHGGQVVLSGTAHAKVEVRCVDLGEHRLKDIEEPVWIYQLGEERFPPIRTISLSKVPLPATPLVGRVMELEEIGELFEAGNRMVTLTGPGGSGKTRLANEVALDRVPKNRSGVFWVPLTGIGDPSLVLTEVGSVLGAPDDLEAYLKDRELLIVLDNFEHVIEAAPDVASLLKRSSGLTLLVTSREALRVEAEMEFALDVLGSDDAVTLFCSRSRRPPSDAVRTLCDRLDRLPLAIELAGARARTLDPDLILERLGQRLDLFSGARDAEPRQRSLRATIEWSYDLLDESEQQMFAALGVFAAGFDVDAATDVASTPLDGLLALAEKSLISVDGQRFKMLETVRTFALEVLASSGREAEMRRAHAAYYLQLATSGPVRLPSTDELESWKSLLNADHDNLRAAMDFLMSESRFEDAQALAAGLNPLWIDHGFIAEGRERSARALEGDLYPSAARGWALNGAALLSAIAGDIDAARRAGTQAVDVGTAIDDALIVARASQTLGYVFGELREWETSEGWLRRSIEGAERAEDLRLVGWATRTLAWTLIERGQAEEARKLHETNLELARRTSDRALEAVTLRALGILAHERGERAEAGRLIGRALDLLSAQHEDLETAESIVVASGLVCEAALGVEAASMLGSAEVVFAEFGAEAYMRRDLERVHERLSTVLGPEEFQEAMERGRKMRMPEAVATAKASLDQAIALSV